MPTYLLSTYLSSTYRWLEITYVLFQFPYLKYFVVFQLSLCIHFYRFMNLIPITFLTGFYVTQVVGRYWDQFMSLPWPDKIAMKLVSFIPGKVIFNLIAGFLRKKNPLTIICFLWFALIIKFLKILNNLTY